MVRKEIQILIFILISIQFNFVGMAAASSQSTSKLTLEDCLRLGLANNHNLQIAAKNILVAQQNVKKAEAGSGFKVNYDVNHNQGASSSSNSASVSLDYPIFKRSKFANELKVAQLELENVREDERQTKLQLIYDIKNAYYSLWLKEQQLVVAYSSCANLEQHYNTIKKYCEVGKKAEYELLEAEVVWKQQKALVTSATNEVVLAKLDLATLIGIDPDQDVQISYDGSLQVVPAKLQLELKTLLEKAFQQRPDLRQTVNNIKIAELGVAIAKTNKMPNLSLGSTYTDSDKEFRYTFGVNGTLYDGNETVSLVKVAEKKVDIEEENHTKARQTVRQKLQKVIQNAGVDLVNAQAYKATSDLAKEDLRLTEIRYNAGMSTIMDVKDRQLAFDKSQNNYYQAVASYITDVAQLDLELGNQF